MADPAEISRFTDFALELASSARLETLPRWEEGCPIEDKGSGTFDPVTEADRAAEQAMRANIARQFPHHGISGEEWPDRLGEGRLCWSLDPIDGTRSFICQLPNWVTLIALLEDGAPILGVIDAPCLDEVYVGAGGEAWMIRKGERSPLCASGCTRLSEARFATTDPFACGPPPEAIQPLLATVRTARFGHDGYAYARLAAGSIDLVIESGLKPHDYQALIPVVTAAGGHVGDWSGGADFASGQLIAAATPELYAEAVALLA